MSDVARQRGGGEGGGYEDLCFLLVQQSDSKENKVTEKTMLIPVSNPKYYPRMVLKAPCNSK